MHIIMVGNLTSGYFAIGPYYSYKEADTYAKQYVGDGHFVVVAVEKPALLPLFK